MLRSHFARESGRDGKIILPPSRQQMKKSIRTKASVGALREKVKKSFFTCGRDLVLGSQDNFFIISVVLISDYIVRVRVCMSERCVEPNAARIDTSARKCAPVACYYLNYERRSLALDRRLWRRFRIAPVATRQSNCLNTIVWPCSCCCFGSKGWKISVHHAPKICLLVQYFQLCTFALD